MKRNLKRFTGMAISAAMLIQPAAIFAVDGETAEVSQGINYILCDEFDKSSDGTFDTCGWTVGTCKTGLEAEFPSSHWSMPNMVKVGIPSGGEEMPGSTSVIRKELENPIDLTKQKVVIETIMSTDTTYGINVDFGYNRPESYGDMSDDIYTSRTNTLFRITGDGTRDSGGNACVKVGMLNQNHGLTNATNVSAATGTPTWTNGIPLMKYGDSVTVKTILDYQNNLISYYITAPDGATYTRDGWNDEGNMKVNGASQTSLESLDFSAWCADGSKYWIDSVKVYKIVETKASVSENVRCDKPIRVKFTNTNEIAADLSDFVSLKTKDGKEVPSENTYCEGIVTITPESELLGETEYTVSVDTEALSKIAVNCTTASLKFKTLGDGVYVDDTTTTTNIEGWTASDGITFPNSHWAGGSSLMFNQTGEIKKNFTDSIDLTSGKVMLDVSVLADVGAKVDFNVNNENNTIFSIGYDQGKGNISVRTKNGTSAAFNPNMTVGDTEKETGNGRPYFVFAERINVKAILDYSTKTVNYYVAFSDNPNTTNTVEDESVRIYTRDGWGDNNNMPNIEAIENISFKSKEDGKKFWVESVKISKAAAATASISTCTTDGAEVQFAGAEGDFGEYIDLYTRTGEKVQTEKTYLAQTNTVRLAAKLNNGEPYYVKAQPVKMIGATGVAYSGNLELHFIPTVKNLELTEIDTNRGVGGYFRAKVKNVGNEERNVMVIIAEKNAAGALVQAKIDMKKIAAGESESFEANFTSVDSQNVLEAYVWDAESYEPMINEYTVLGK